MAIRDWSTTAASNNAAAPNGFPENMAPSGVNNAARELMAQVRGFYEEPMWTDFGDDPTRTGDTTFTVVGDLTARYIAGKTIRAKGSATSQHTIVSASYSAPDTTITISGANLPATLTTVELLQAQYYGITTSETAAGVTPTNYHIPDHNSVGIVHPARYGGVSDATTDSTTALANAFLVAAQAKCPVYVGGGSGYKSTANITVPVGQGSAIDIIGSGWTTGGILFSGASVTTGLTYTGTDYSYAGAIYDAYIRCTSSAVRCVSYTDVNHPRIVRCHLAGAAGAAARFYGTLMGVLDHTLITGSGSATEGSIEVDGESTGTDDLSTTFHWVNSRISGAADTTVGGLIINRTLGIHLTGGAIESCGQPLRIGNKSETTRGCIAGFIKGVDFENPGENNSYIELGAGLSSNAYVSAIHIEGNNGSPSTTAQVDHAVDMTRTNGVTFGVNNWALAGTPVSFYEYNSTGNLGGVIEAHRSLYDATASATPWVRVNGAQVVAATPRTRWAKDEAPNGLVTEKTITGATPSVNICDQGGYHRNLLASNGGATTVTSLSGGERSMEIYIRANDGNTTLTHGTGSGQFITQAGSNLTMTSGKVYHFTSNGTAWMQI